MKTRHLLAFFAALCLTCFIGCDGEKKADDHNHDHGSHHEHAHTAPHGGTLILLGDHQYHLELIQDKASGKMTAYVLDGEAEKFIRIAQESLKLSVVIDNQSMNVVLVAVPNSATGEKSGDTSCFEGQADWLKNASTFEVVLEKVDIRGTTFSTVKFPFPKGNH
ncbi:MAG: hypothetical protein LBV12_08255 [Puniceicoccales bacterium]|jgi:hypothetical protein|nr:hypothetical protein [Puniceicoccales bacterium]